MKEKIKTLESQLQTVKERRQQIDLIHTLIWEIVKTDLPRSSELLQKAKAQLKIDELIQGRYEAGFVENLLSTACIELHKGNFELACTKAREVTVLCEQTQQPILLTKALEVTSIACIRMGNPTEALNCLLKGLAIAEMHNDVERKADLYNGLAIVYVNLGDHQKGANNFAKSLHFCREIGDTYGETRALTNLCMSYKDLGHYTESLQYGNEGLQLARLHGYGAIEMWVTSNLGNTYVAQENYQEALGYFQRSIALAQQLGDTFEQAFTLLSVARSCYQQQQFALAKSYAQLALEIAQKSKQQGFQFEAHELLTNIYKHEKEFEQALRHHEQFHEIKESIFNQEADDKLKHLEVLYRTKTAEKEAEIYQLRYVELQREITEREYAQKALVQAQKLESLGILAGGVAHDFNNLLVSMLGQIGLALRKLSPEHPASRHLTKANQSAERAAELALQMLAYSGHGQFDVVACNLNEFLDQNSHLLRSVISGEIQLHFNLAEHLPLIRVDQTQLQQVLINLVVNAVEAKATTVTVHTCTQSVNATDSQYWQYTAQPLAAGDYVSVIVEDNGIGMDATTQEKIFDPFFTTKFTGRGLGLAAALGIIRGHQGGIAVQSFPQEGSKFQIVLPPIPLLEPQLLAPAAPAATTVLPEQTGKILVIDDQATVRDTIMEMLSQFQFSAVAFSDGASGLQYYQEHAGEVGLVLLDLTMPGIDGVQTWREMRTLNPQAKIIISSGFGTDVLQRFDEPVEFLPKPYTLETLIEIISKHLN